MTTENIVRDVSVHEALARAARAKADGSTDADLARRLREAAIKHERMARRLRRQRAELGGSNGPEAG
ncbi:hypothetical protein B0I00_3231 [Novosphingobium kunmingense]|uniref:Uncharacterized protein n=1 Tax=Novosphingobium kunmingense TaxID=1211806 RepID=A0A2N0H3B0_9SPHN|nr:hypothetical protein [Novosphingobium kunmingense]PKB13432.1 hypothetical protein B0I00_3231 [Novosphingobium kunmingense]